jgi:hypothetical protein
MSQVNQPKELIMYRFTAAHTLEAYQAAVATFQERTGWDPMGVAFAAAAGEALPLHVFGAGIFLDCWDCWLFTDELERLQDPASDLVERHPWLDWA